MPRPTKKQSQEKALMKIVSELSEVDPNISDVGVILATLGDSDPDKLQALWKASESLEDFLAIASTQADISLVVEAMRAALGYDYEEIEELYKEEAYEKANGEVITIERPVGKKVRKKHAKKNDALLKFLLVNRLPQYFSDSRKIEINKKTIEIKGTTEAEIRKFAGDLVKIIDSEFVEIENDKEVIDN